MTPEITEADVVAWLAARAKEHAEEFGGYGSAEAHVLYYDHTGKSAASFYVGAGGLVKGHTGETIEQARQSACKETPDGVAAEKRATAARLLAEADKLEGKA